MARFVLRRHKPAGAPPGSVEFVGEQKMEKARLRVIDYSADRLDEHELEAFAQLHPFRDGDGVSWVNVDGLHETEAMAELAEHFGLHSLVMEDVANTNQRAKFEEYPEQIFIVMRMLYMQPDSLNVHSEQVSLIFGKGWVLTFQERVGDIFEGVRQRLRAGKTRMRRSGSDYLAYALADALVDHHFKILETLGEHIEGLEEKLLDNPDPTHLEDIHRLKRELVLLRRAVWPLREAIGSWIRSESPLIEQETSIFLRDVHDHVVQVVDAVDTYRDLLGSLQDLYLSSLSNRMNEVMKVLTLIATIFIPLSFLAGIFGMNFQNMPELGWRWSYPIFWLVILAVGGGMVAWFKNKRWL